MFYLASHSVLQYKPHEFSQVLGYKTPSHLFSLDLKILPARREYLPSLRSLLQSLNAIILNFRVS